MLGKMLRRKFLRDDQLELYVYAFFVVGVLGTVFGMLVADRTGVWWLFWVTIFVAGVVGGLCYDVGGERKARHALDVARRTESTCGRCEGLNVVWFAPSPLWNTVMRGGTIYGPELFGGIVCMVCFAELAEGLGIASLWRLNADRIEVELETVTPSGRVWDEVANLWINPDRDETEP